MISQDQRSQDFFSRIQWAEGLFAAAGVPNPRIDAEILLASVLDIRRMDLYLHPGPLRSPDLERFAEWVERRIRREPLQYIIGEAPFFGRSFAVSRDVLIPRPETELLVEQCLKRMRRPRRILDVGTGSGCIAVTLACELPEAEVGGVDCEIHALSVARQNARRHGVSRRTQWVCGDLVHAIRKEYQADLMTANLPYVPDPQISHLQEEVRDFEPLSALSGGENGLRVIQRLVADASRILRPGGLLALEIGDGQGGAVGSLIEATGCFQDVESLRDLAGYTRMVLANKKTRTP